MKIMAVNEKNEPIQVSVKDLADAITNLRRNQNNKREAYARDIRNEIIDYARSVSETTRWPINDIQHLCNLQFGVNATMFLPQNDREDYIALAKSLIDIVADFKNVNSMPEPTEEDSDEQ